MSLVTSQSMYGVYIVLGAQRCFDQSVLITTRTKENKG